MSTQQDICATGSENRPPMLNNDNYVPWSTALLRYAKSKANRKLLYNSIINDSYFLIAQKEEARIQLQAEEFDLMTTICDIDEIEEVNANCILMTNLQQASILEEHVENNRGTVEQHPTIVEETRAYLESLYNNLVTDVEKVNMVNRKMCDTNADLTTELILKDEIATIVNQIDARVQNFEMQFLKEVAKFVRDFKSIAKEASESLDKT
ncbi:hypothetical protein Tco_0770349 [Tanacetum coccineum]|uniref:Uncharacterized protein n=1 Tax=Tanacetum coccineum TaxID=301880 RepID=A0ABQ4ZFV3_9ASTR